MKINSVRREERGRRELVLPNEKKNKSTRGQNGGKEGEDSQKHTAKRKEGSRGWGRKKKPNFAESTEDLGTEPQDRDLVTAPRLSTDSISIFLSTEGPTVSFSGR